MTHARRRSLYGQPNFNKRSRFLDDVPEQLLDTVVAAPTHAAVTATVRSDRTGSYTVTPTATAPAPKAPDWKSPFEIGQKVRHAKFGIGVVIACAPLKGDAEVTVAFPGVVGVKKLIQSFAKLEGV